jgi:hypothetical protein
MPEAALARAQQKNNGKAHRELLPLPGVVVGGVWFFPLFWSFRLVSFSVA